MSSENTGTGLGSILRDLRNVVSELFGGDRLAKDQEAPVSVLFALIGYVAKADSIVTSHEAEFINTLMDEMNLPSGGREVAFAAFEKGRQRALDIPQELLRISGTHALGSSALRQWLDILIRVAMADGRLFPSERATLKEVANALGFDDDTLKQRLVELDVSKL